jgi:APA family basic amino acid/polyamine antiporter
LIATPNDVNRSVGLRRELGLLGAVTLGMGSIVGTGVFVSIGIGAEVAGGWVLLAILLASLIAMCNGLSSAQLAALHPLSGGTYEYGYRWATPQLGFTAGWMFLCAKSASAATAALGFSGYLLRSLELDVDRWLVPTAWAAVAVLTALVLSGIKRSAVVNLLIVGVTLGSLAFFVAAGTPVAVARSRQNLIDPMLDRTQLSGIWKATALMFVAYTGYGRIATLSEEVKRPERTIPRAVITVLLAAMLLYAAVAFVGLGTVGAAEYAAATRRDVAPLQVIAGEFGVPWGSTILTVGAITAMLGVLLNLLLGLSRVLMAMGRRGDMPAVVATVNARTGDPSIATLTIAAVIAGLTALRDVRLTWSFSAFTVLVYYALTNLCALRIDRADRRYPSWIAVCGLLGSAFLAFWVERKVWLAGLALIAVGLVWQSAARAIRR